MGYVGSKEALPILLYGLRNLEYRGYDSAGVAVRGESGTAAKKAVGKISELAAAVGDGAALRGTVGIAHTRWATHGSVTVE